MAEHIIAKLIDEYHADTNELPRPHLGCSMLGHPCDRWLWLSFRWAVREKISGRIRRLFRRGHNEEATILDDLQAAGTVLARNPGGDQMRVDFGSHVSGSIDAVIESGVPGAPHEPHLAEFKTHNKASFNELEKAGSVEAVKPNHFIQMQTYMRGTGINKCLYIAVCKDDDRLYIETVHYNEAVAAKAIERGQRIATADRMPPGISKDPTWYQCKMCPAHSFCHVDKLTKEINCRTCAHSSALENSAWRCEQFNDNIPLEFQRQGCDAHTLHPDLVPWELMPSSVEWVAVYNINGRNVGNGEPGPGVFSSAELIAGNAEINDRMGADVAKWFPNEVAK